MHGRFSFHPRTQCGGGGPPEARAASERWWRGPRLRNCTFVSAFLRQKDSETLLRRNTPAATTKRTFRGPLHHASRVPPLSRRRIKRGRSRDACAPELCQRHSQRTPQSMIPSDLASGGTGFHHDHAHQTKGSGTPAGALIHPPHQRMRLALSGARSPSGVPPRLSPRGLLIPKAQRWAMLPGDDADKRRVTPAGAGSGCSDAPRMPVIVPAG